MTAAELAERLGARRSGNRWLARCPAHDDRTPSLSIAEGEGGRVLLHCWAGCANSAVLGALGLTWADVGGAPATSEDRARLRREREQRKVAVAVEREHRDSLAAAETQLQAHAARLAARLAAVEWAGAAPAYPGEAEALAADCHAALSALHEMETA